MGEMEDEFHFVLVCPGFLDIREKYIKTYYYRKPSFLNLYNCLAKTTLNLPINYVNTL